VKVQEEIIDTGRKKLGAILGDNVKTGINVSLMPGVLVGPNSQILPGAVVFKNVE
jgi:bifunctional UDP-N-acetylglucosamine pyrophosphorylase/glucosamine-1-phosphate N-acetyltransferase